jgi:hypothetical protein
MDFMRRNNGCSNTPKTELGCQLLVNCDRAIRHPLPPHVAALTLCFLCSALHAAVPAQAPISLSISKRRGSASARAMRANCRSVRRGVFVAAAVIVER